MSEEGKKLGLIDAIVPSSELLKVSRQWTLDIAERRKPWMRSLYKTDKIGSLSEAREVLKVAREQVKQTAKKMPQHLACIGVIEEGIIHGGYNGVLKVLFFCKQYLCTVNMFPSRGHNNSFWMFCRKLKYSRTLCCQIHQRVLFMYFFSQRSPSKV